MSPAILALALTLAVFVGLALGLLGGGGSILTVPLLVYVVGLPAHEAIAASLFVVGATSVAALVPHARERRVHWRTGLLFGVASMAGAFAAGRVAKGIPATVLLLLFGGMMLTTAVFMMKGRKESTSKGSSPAGARRYAAIAAEGLVVGAFTGLVGAGGGFLVVPALVLLGGLSMRDAVGTSLLVISMKSFAGFAGYLSATAVNWPLVLMVTASAILGSLGGARLASRVPQDLLRRGFAWFVVIMAVFILSQEVPKALGVHFSLREHWPLELLLLAGPIVAAVVNLSRIAKARPAAVPAHG